MKLKCERVWLINSYDFDKFARHNFRELKTYDFQQVGDCFPNDSFHMFDLDGDLSDIEVSNILDQIENDDIEDNNLLLNYCCYRDLIPAGKYCIAVSW